MSEKSEKLLNLERLENSVYISWIRDEDKVAELEEIIHILKEMLQLDSIESYFRSTNPEDLKENFDKAAYNHFITKFSESVILNLSRQYYVYGTNGDDVCLEIFVLFTKLFLKHMDNPELMCLFSNIKEIFDSNKPYYKGGYHIGGVGSNVVKTINHKKQMTSEKYNSSLPDIKKRNFNLNEGDFIDIKIENKRAVNYNADRYYWTRGIVKSVFDDYFSVSIAEELNDIMIDKDSFEYSEVSSMTKDYDWRINLNKDDMIDCWDRGRWMPATVLRRREEIVNHLKRVDYHIGFRVFKDNLGSSNEDQMNNLKSYSKFWPNKHISRNINGREYLGDVENMDEWIGYYSKRIQMLNSKTSMTSGSEKNSMNTDCFFVDDLIPFNNKNYVVARQGIFSYYFVQLLSEFARIDGFNIIINKLKSKEINFEVLQLIFYILSSAFPHLHRDYLIVLSKDLEENTLNLLRNITDKDLRMIKKETTDLMLVVLRNYLKVSKGSDESNAVIDNFNLSFALRLLKTNFLDKRIAAVKTIVDHLISVKYSAKSTEYAIKQIESNNIFNEIFGSNSHIQLVKISKDLVEFLLEHGKLKDQDVALIWNATKKGDLEGKLSVLDILTKVHSLLSIDQINALLDNIFSQNQQDIIIQEVDLIFKLSQKSYYSGEENSLQRCFDYFINILIANEEKFDEEKEKVDFVVKSLILITKKNPSYKSKIINFSLDSFECNKNSIVGMKLIEQLLLNVNIEHDFDIETLLLNDHKLQKCFLKSLKNFVEQCFRKGIVLDESNRDINERIIFFNFLVDNTILWDNTIKPHEFLYELFSIENNSVNNYNKSLRNVYMNNFYKWIKEYLDDHQQEDMKLEIFDIFNNRICKDKSSLQNLTLNAFDSYMFIFLDINSYGEEKLKYFRSVIYINF